MPDQPAAGAVSPSMLDQLAKILDSGSARLASAQGGGAGMPTGGGVVSPGGIFAGAAPRQLLSGPGPAAPQVNLPQTSPLASGGVGVPPPHVPIGRHPGQGGPYEFRTKAGAHAAIATNMMSSLTQAANEIKQRSYQKQAKEAEYLMAELHDARQSGDTARYNWLLEQKNVQKILKEVQGYVPYEIKEPPAAVTGAQAAAAKIAQEQAGAGGAEAGAGAGAQSQDPNVMGNTLIPQTSAATQVPPNMQPGTIQPTPPMGIPRTTGGGTPGLGSLGMPAGAGAPGLGSAPTPPQGEMMPAPSAGAGAGAPPPPAMPGMTPPGAGAPAQPQGPTLDSMGRPQMTVAPSAASQLLGSEARNQLQMDEVLRRAIQQDPNVALHMMSKGDPMQMEAMKESFRWQMETRTEALKTAIQEDKQKHEKEMADIKASKASDLEQQRAENRENLAYIRQQGENNRMMMRLEHMANMMGQPKPLNVKQIGDVRNMKLAAVKTVASIDSILKNQEVLRGFYSSARAYLSGTPGGRLLPATPEQRAVEVAFTRLEEQVNRFRAAYQATGFRSNESWRALQGLRGKYGQDPDNTISLLNEARDDAMRSITYGNDQLEMSRVPVDLPGDKPPSETAPGPTEAAAPAPAAPTPSAGAKSDPNAAGNAVLKKYGY